MATAKNTTSNQNGSTSTKASRTKVALPALDVKEGKPEDIKAKPAEHNPYIDAVRTANGDHTKSYRIHGVTTKPVADKVQRMLSLAGKIVGCSVKSEWEDDSTFVAFRARKLITHKAK